jgi:(S)-sulfolactate dehydrogenase
VADIVISEFMDELAVEWLAARYDVKYDASLVEDRGRLRQLGGQCRALVVRNRTKVDQEILDSYPRLKVVGRLGVGLDNIDVSTCRERSIEVMPAAGGNTISVAEYVLAAAIILRRGAFFGTDAVLAGTWPRQKMIGSELSGATLGLVGLGTIAQATAERARVFGMNIHAYDPFLPAENAAWQDVRRHEVVADLVAEADVVSLHVPLTQKTRGLFDKSLLRRMKKEAVLINTARGGIIEEAALADALKAGAIGGAALDVFEDEPLRDGSALIGAPNLIATPHVAGVTKESNTRISWITAKNVARVLEAAT